MQATLTITGTIDELAELLPAITATSTINERRSGEVDVLRFLGMLTDTGRLAVVDLARTSVDGYENTRGIWADNIDVEDPDTFNGILGAIGRAWARVTDQPNPFVSHGLDEDGRHLHEIKDRKLAKELYGIMTERFEHLL